MAAANVDPTVPKQLTKAEIDQRVEVLTSRIKERSDIREKKRAANDGWNADLKLLNEQIDTIATEIRTKSAWVPAQMVMPGTGDEGPGDDDNDGEDDDDAIVDVPGQKPAKKKRAGKRTALRPVR